MQQAARQRRQSGRLQGHSQTQIAEPEVSWQTLEALFVQQDTPAWHSDLDQHSNSQHAQTQLSVQLNNAPESLKEKEERRKRQDFYANVGDAIRTLREDIPRLFMRDLALEIYRDDVVFKDPRNTVKGKTNYERLFKAVRIFGRFFFSRVYIEVQRIWQPDERTIRMRWKLHGTPRIPWEVEGIFEGISTFKLDKEGKIYEHAVDNVVLRDPPMGISPLWNNLQRIFAPPQQALPGLSRYETQCSPAAPEQEASYLSRFSFVRLYSAVLSYMQLMQPLSIEPGQG